VLLLPAVTTSARWETRSTTVLSALLPQRQQLRSSRDGQAGPQAADAVKATAATAAALRAEMEGPPAS